MTTEEWLAANLATAPPLTPQQLAILRPIFGPALARTAATARHDASDAARADARHLEACATRRLDPEATRRSRPGTTRPECLNVKFRHNGT
jgi:hypothetical protein